MFSLTYSSSTTLYANEDVAEEIPSDENEEKAQEENFEESAEEAQEENAEEIERQTEMDNETTVDEPSEEESTEENTTADDIEETAVPEEKTEIKRLALRGPTEMSIPVTIKVFNGGIYLYGYDWAEDFKVWLTKDGQRQEKLSFTRQSS